MLVLQAEQVLSASAAMSIDHLPAAQSEQALAPLREYPPALPSEQLVAPMMFEDLPASHFEHSCA